jgi:hypothetical protein
MRWRCKYVGFVRYDSNNESWMQGLSTAISTLKIRNCSHRYSLRQWRVSQSVQSTALRPHKVAQRSTFFHAWKSGLQRWAASCILEIIAFLTEGIYGVNSLQRLKCRHVHVGNTSHRTPTLYGRFSFIRLHTMTKVILVVGATGTQGT